jgi:hypothetical protein
VRNFHGLLVLAWRNFEINSGNVAIERDFHNERAEFLN